MSNKNTIQFKILLMNKLYPFFTIDEVKPTYHSRLKLRLTHTFKRFRWPNFHKGCMNNKNYNFCTI